MPFKDPQKRREWVARYKREIQRPREKARAAKRAEQERLRRERAAQLRSEGRAPMQLREELVFDERTYPVGTIIHVIPGLVDWWERKGLATEMPQRVSTGVARITKAPEAWEAPPEGPRGQRTQAGY